MRWGSLSASSKGKQPKDIGIPFIIIFTIAVGYIKIIPGGITVNEAIRYSLQYIPVLAFTAFLAYILSKILRKYVSSNNPALVSFISY